MGAEDPPPLPGAERGPPGNLGWTQERLETDRVLLASGFEEDGNGVGRH